ncbi:MAG: Glu/Leu/Phe/Val dehydrogenase dimerization domain-containing protein [Pseudomonadota bacterium]
MQLRDVETEGWRRVVRVEDETAGLLCFIAVHDATLGPGCGGVRVFPYADEDAALRDVKNLSRGMTYKNALGGIPFGGGKAVIVADPRKDKTPAMFKAFGEALNALEGLYYTAEDSGVTDEDLAVVRGVTPYAGGVAKDGVGGNPSPFTARGVWRGIEAAARARLGREDLNGASVSILGVGAVGMALAGHLHDAGARLVVADVFDERVEEAAARFGAAPATPAEAPGAAVDIYAPCALGGAIDAQTLGELRAGVVAGAANNQLATPDMDEGLRAKGVLYAPDFVINAAGVISVGLEILGQWSADELNARIDKIGDTLSEIFQRADAEGRATGAVADDLALEIINRAR